MRVKLLTLIIPLILILSACSLGGSKTPPTPTPTDTPIPLPTFTPTPVVPLAILVVPVNMDQTVAAAYEKVVYDLAQGSGLRFQVRNSLAPADLEPGLKIVIALPPDPGIAALAAAAPQVQFLAVNIPGINAAGNISVLAQNSQPDVSAFVAGYTAALITDDYRIGMIIPKDNTEAQKAAAAFTNGMAFYCGLCRPFYYAAFSYPQFIEIPASEDKSNYSGYANYLINDRKVYTLYVYPTLANDDFMAYLGTTGVQIMGNATPNPKPAGWAMTLRADEIKAIQNAWSNLLGGQGGLTVQSPLGLADVDPALLSPGRQRLVQQILDELLAGRITTRVNP